MTGVLGFIWAIFWIWLYRDPEKHSSVTPEQLARLQADRGPCKSAAAAKISWSSLFRYRTVWGMMTGFFCLNFVIYFFITWFPTYLVQAGGFSLKKLGTLGILPALFAIPSGWLGGYVSDSLYRGGWSLTWARKTCQFFCEDTRIRLLAVDNPRCAAIGDLVPSAVVTVGSAGETSRSDAFEATQWETAHYGALECCIQIVVSWLL